jgi:hypothetical protein
VRCSLVAVAVGLVFGCFVSGCGRLSFEGDGSGPGSTPQLEITPPVAISLPGRRAVCPTVVWNGSGWAVAWLDGDRDSYFVLLDAAGVPQGNITAVANERFLGNCPSLIWTGTEYVVTLDRQVCVPHSVEVHRFSADGARLGTVDPASPLGADAFDPSIAWNGSGFHLSWTLRVTYPTPDAIRFAQLDAAGKPIGTDYPLSMSPTFAHYSTVLGTPPRSVAVWGEERAVRFATLEAGAVTRQMPILTTGRLVEPVAAAWTGSELGLAWLSDPFHLWFVLADPATGITTVPDETAEIIGQIKPRLAAYPKGFGLVLNYPMAIPSLKFALRDTSGAKVGDATPLSDAGRFPALAFGGDRFAVVYIDQDRVQLVFIKP